jgi:hypothetical protein
MAVGKVKKLAILLKMAKMVLENRKSRLYYSKWNKWG